MFIRKKNKLLIQEIKKVYNCTNSNTSDLVENMRTKDVIILKELGKIAS